jgi:NTE family protein
MKAGAVVARVEVDASQLRHVNPAYVKKNFEADGKPSALDEERVRAEVAGLLGEGDYERIDYAYVDRENGERVLVITPREKPWGPGYLRFGLRLATDFKEDVGFNLLGSYRRHWVNRLGAQWRNDFSLGQTTGLRSELYQPLALEGGAFLAPSLTAGQRSANIFFGNDAIARYRIQELGGRLDVGWTFDRYAELRLGVERGGLHYEPSIAVPFAPSADFSSGGVAADLFVDRLDSASFPRSGYLLAAGYRDSLEVLGADVDYRKGLLLGLTSLSAGRHTIQLELRGGGALEGDLPVYDLVSLGGLFNLSGYQNNQLQGQTFALGRAAYYYRLIGVPVVLRGLYAGVSLELGQVWGRLDGSSASGLLPAAALFIGADSALGPFHLAWGHGFDDNLNTIYFYLGTFY